MDLLMSWWRSKMKKKKMKEAIKNSSVLWAK
jgi:hypothetical protein